MNEVEVPSSGARFHLRRWALVALVVWLGFAFQGSRGVWEPDEGFYSNVAVGMLDRGDAVTPHLNGEPFLDKPPLVYWGAALGMLALGRNEWGLRAANAFWYVGAALLAGVLARRLLGPELENEAVLLQALSPLPFLAANVLTPDTPLAFAVVAAMASFWYVRSSESRAARLAANLSFGASVALGVLAKGPAMLIFLAPLALFVLVRDGIRGALRSVDLALSGAVGLACALAWYLAVAGALPGGWQFVLDNQVFGRLTGSKYGRNDDWLGPLRVYVPALVLGLLPWGLIEILRQRIRPIRDWRWPKPDEAGLFLALCFAFPLAVLWMATSRLPLYVLPVIPVCSLWLARRRVRRGRQMTFRTIATAGGILLLLKMAAAYYPTSRDARAMAATLLRIGVSRTEPLIALSVKQNGLAFYGFDPLIWIPAPAESTRFFAPPRPLSEVLPAVAGAGEFAMIYRSPTGEPAALEISRRPGFSCRRVEGPARSRILQCTTRARGRGRSSDPRLFSELEARP